MGGTCRGGTCPRTFLDYDEEEEPWHECIVLLDVQGADCAADEYVILTPDEDVYLETLAVPSLRGLKHGDGGRELPEGLGAGRGQPVYRFKAGQVPGPDDMRRHLAAAQAIVDGLRASNPLLYPAPCAVLPPGSSAAVVPFAAVPDVTNNFAAVPRLVKSEAATRDDAVWVITDSHLGVEFGRVIGNSQVDAYAVILDDRALLQIGGETLALAKMMATDMPAFVEKWRLGVATPRDSKDVGPADARVLPIVRTTRGERFRDFRAVSDACDESVFEDWALTGPRTTAWYIREVGRTGMGPSVRSAQWRHENRLQEDDRLAVEHENWSEALELLSCVDQLDVVNLCGVEAICRQLQYTEHEVQKKVDAKKPRTHVDYFLGRARRAGGGLIAPALVDWVSTKAGKEAAILKEQRKAADEQALLRAKK